MSYKVQRPRLIPALTATAIEAILSMKKVIPNFFIGGSEGSVLAWLDGPYAGIPECRAVLPEHQDNKKRLESRRITAIEFIF